MPAIRRFPLAGFALALVALAPALAEAQAISLVPGTLNIFRDSRGANDVGIGAGERIQYGANIAGGSVGATVGATYAPTGFVSPAGPCGALTVNPNFCANATGYNAGRLGSWDLTFRRGAESLTVATPTLAGAETAIPFAQSVTLSGGGLTPTISWELPGGLVPDGFRINVYDKNLLRPGTALPDVIHSVAIAPGSTSYTLPATLSSGLALSSAGNYTINFQVVETRDGLPFGNNNAQILARSNSFFAFRPLTGTVPGDVALPTIAADGVYHFSIGAVGPDSITFIDPLVATGYDYAIGASGPNFASVLLPNVGDGLFTLDFSDTAGLHSVSLAHGSQFFFGAGGVGAFRVSGIETSAGLDPADATAFITGLTFAAVGGFTGTMTPITTFVEPTAVPEPQTWALMLCGLAGLGGLASVRRRGR